MFYNFLTDETTIFSRFPLNNMYMIHS